MDAQLPNSEKQCALGKASLWLNTGIILAHSTVLALLKSLFDQALCEACMVYIDVFFLVQTMCLCAGQSCVCRCMHASKQPPS